MKNKMTEIDVIKKGSVLITGKPFAFVLKSKLQGERCDFCFKRRETMPRCSGCRFVYYCGPNCQRQGWVDHSSECTGFRKVSPRIVPDAARLMGRIIIKLRKGGDQEKGYYTPTKYRVFKDLMSHYSDLKEDEKRMEHFESLVVVLTSYLGADKLPNTAELLGIFGRICVNSFSILDQEMVSVGTGVYLAPTIIDHSCVPSAVATFEGTTISIRSLQDFPAPLDWTKIRISYIELLESTAERRRELQTAYYFLCDCPRCCDIDTENQTLNAMLCLCGEPIPVPLKVAEGTELSCRSCGHIVESCKIAEYQEEVQVSLLELSRMREVAYLDVTRHCLRRQKGLFHPLDLLHAKMLDSSFDSAISLEQWQEAEEYGKALIPAYKHYYGTSHPLLGILYLKIAKLQNLLDQGHEAALHLHEAKLILSVTHGRDSSLYREQIVTLMQQLAVCNGH